MVELRALRATMLADAMRPLLRRETQYIACSLLAVKSHVLRAISWPVARLRQIPRTSLRDEVYLELQTAIVSGRLAPGERIRDQALAAELGVSRTPVREAFKRLEDDGLVESVAGVSTRVTPISPGAGLETAPVIVALQILAARLGVPRLTEAHISQMRAANRSFESALQARQVARTIAADDEFHGVLVHAAGNETLKRAIQSLLPAIRRLAYRRFTSFAGEESIEQHDKIIAACADRDPEKAAVAVDGNWRNLALVVEAVPSVPKAGAA